MSVYRHLDQDFLQNPYVLLEELRNQGPVQKVITPRGQNMWLVTRYEDVRDALTHKDLSKDINLARQYFSKDDLALAGLDFGAELSNHMLNRDSPDHTRLRRLVSKAFTFRRVESLRSTVESIATSLIQALYGRPTFDLLSDFAFPFPITVISELLGVPIVDRSEFRDWSTKIVTAASVDELNYGTAGMVAYLERLISVKERNPEDDLLTALLESREQGDSLNHAELIAMVFLLLVAGHETTVNAIGNAFIALSEDPSQLELLSSQMCDIPQAVEEFLRFDGPVNLATVRFTKQPTRIASVDIDKAEMVLISLGSANRDQARFENAHMLDLSRDATGHLAFGHGAHHCLGAPLARLELEVALKAILGAFPKIRLLGHTSDLRWRDSMLIRGVETLRVQVDD
ncbi:cytochrome P450 family protein [Streptomyces cinereoruber]|uniref:cytochrome P450 family protein n=1 Tax=Streptomyces cinereoruber TaxID=67260 RepID=UPI003629F6C4